VCTLFFLTALWPLHATSSSRRETYV
jgi:hypothetical protein